MTNQKIYEITTEIIKSMKNISKMSDEDRKKISWRDLEEIWYEYLEEEINKNEI